MKTTRKHDMKKIKTMHEKQEIGPLKERVESLEKYLDMMPPHISRVTKKEDD